MDLRGLEVVEFTRTDYGIDLLLHCVRSESFTSAETSSSG